MEAWLKVSKGHCESGHYLESNFSVETFSAEIFSAEIFTAEIFTAEPSLRNLHCGTLTAEASLRSSSAEIALLGFHTIPNDTVNEMYRSTSFDYMKMKHVYHASLSFPPRLDDTLSIQYINFREWVLCSSKKIPLLISWFGGQTSTLPGLSRIFWLGTLEVFAQCSCLRKDGL